MPISMDDFEETDRDALDIRGGNKRKILAYLLENDDNAFTAAEIADATDVSENSVSPVLSRLRAEGLVRHRGRYWAITDN